MAHASMFFPPDFKWGTATSSFQVEGENHNSDWWQWEQEAGSIIHGHRSSLACNWWADAESDLDRAAALGTTAHRLSLEWSRIEPEPSVFSDEALGRYRLILQACHDRGLEPMVTLHHFSNPLWLVEKGDFDSDLVVDYFQRYVSKVVTFLGDLVPMWVTINEPLVYVLFRYLDDAFPPPRERGWSAGMRAIRHMLRCHAAAYHTIKELYPSVGVGVAKHFRPLDPRPDGTFLDRWWAGRLAHLFNDQWMESMVSGRLRWPFGRGKVAHLAGTFDFVGINYYSRSLVRFPPRRGRLYEPGGAPGSLMVDGDYFELFPQGLFETIKAAVSYNKPIYITENGLPDKKDKVRARYILSHLREVWRAISFNYPVMGYYYWTLVDNFEWERGWTQRFGLFELDEATQERRPRPSADLYREICQSNSINSDMTARFAPSLMPILFPGQPPKAGLSD